MPTTGSPATPYRQRVPSLEDVQNLPLAELADLGQFLRERSSAAERFPHLDFTEKILSQTSEIQNALEKRVRDESALVQAHASDLLKAVVLLPQASVHEDVLESLCVRDEICVRIAGDSSRSHALAHYRQNRASYHTLFQRSATSAALYSAPYRKQRRTSLALSASGRVRSTDLRAGTASNHYCDLAKHLRSRQEEDGLGTVRSSSPLFATLLEMAIYLSSAAAATQLVYKLILIG